MDDLSELIDNFLKSNKKLFIFNPSTGRGKSYAVVKEIEKLVKSGGIKNRFFYITDRRANIDEQEKKLREAGVDCLVLKSYTDCVSDYFASGKQNKLPSEFKDRPEWKKLSWSHKQYQSSQKGKSGSREDVPDDDPVYRDFSDAERSFRHMVSRKLEKVFRENGKDSADALTKLAFVESKQQFAWILDMYPFAAYCRYNVILLTAQKFIGSFDPIVDRTVVLYNDSAAMKDSICFFDESDACKQAMIRSFGRDADNNEVELVGIVRRYKTLLEEYIGGKYPDEFWDKNFGDRAERILDRISELEKWGLTGGMTIRQDGGLFMYADRNKVLFGDRVHKWYINKAAGKNNEFFVSEEKPDVEGNTLEWFANQCRYVFIKTNRLLHGIACMCRGGDLSRGISAVMEISGLNQCECRMPLQQFIAGSINRSNEGPGRNHADYYLNPGAYVCGRMQSHDSVKMGIYVKKLFHTPEEILYGLLECGAKLILSSATAMIRSASSNFDIDWDPLLEQRYDMPDCDRNAYLDYCRKRDCYDGDFTVIGPMLMECNVPAIGRFDRMKQNGILNQVSYNILESDSKSGDSSSYRHERMMEVALFIYKFCTGGGHAALVFLPQNTERSGMDGKDTDMALLKTYLGFMHIDVQKDCVIESMMASGIDSVKKKLEKHNKKKDIRPFIIVTTYASAGKGLNLQCETELLDDAVAVNDDGRKKLLQGGCLAVDFDGIFLGEPTYLFNSRYIMEESYYIESMAAGGYSEINRMERKNMLCRLIDPENNKQIDGKGREKKTIWSNSGDKRFPNNYIGAMMARMIQAVGRISRTGIKRKTVYVGVATCVVTKIRSNGVFDIDQLFYNLFGSDFQFMPKEARIFVSDLFENAGGRIPSFDIHARNDYAIALVQEALKKNADGDPSGYKMLRRGLESMPCIMGNGSDGYEKYRQQFSGQKWDATWFYIECKNFMSNDYVSQRRDHNNGFLGYSYTPENCGCDSRENHVEEVYPRGTGRMNITDDPFYLDYFGKRKQELFGEDSMITKTGVLSSCSPASPAWVLGPKGIEMYKGIIGERIGEYIFEQELGIVLSELDDPVYETADDIFIMDGRLFCIDFKYYGQARAESYYDQKQPNIDRFEKKLKRCEQYYDMPGILFAINTRPSSYARSRQDAEVYPMVENRIYTVPYIVYPDGYFADHVICGLKDIIEKWRCGAS